MSKNGLRSLAISKLATIRRTISATAMFCWIVTLSLVLFGQQRNASPSSLQGSNKSGAADGKATQRWIPIDRRKLGELGRLGELLQSPAKNQPPAPSNDLSESSEAKSQSSLPIDLSKVDLRSIEETLANLSPEQRERLKKLATELSKNENIKDFSSAYKNLPQSLVDQVRESPSLRQFANDVIENGLDEEQAADNGFPLSDDTNGQPWIKFDPANSSLKTNSKTESPKSESSDSNTRPEPSATSGTATSGTATSGTATSGTASKESTEKSSGERSGFNMNSNGNKEGRVSRSNDSDSFGGSSRGNSQNRNARSNEFTRGPSTPANNRSNSTRTPQQQQQPTKQQPSAASNAGAAKPETAFESLRRRVGELGLGQTFEKLAKEAVGIEQSREEGSDARSKSAQTQQESNRQKSESTRNARNQASSGKRPSELDRNEPAASTRDNTDTQRKSFESQVSDSQSSHSTVPSSANEPQSATKTASPQNSQANTPTSSWRVPTWNDFPSFSYWHLGGLLLIVLVVGGVLLMNRTPEMVRNVAQRRREAEERARLLDMEIANREQVVLAFDTFASRQLRSFEDWWTSQRIVKYVTDQKLQYSNHLQAAEHVYKSARYSPPDQELSEDEIATVRNAIRECTKPSESK